MDIIIVLSLAIIGVALLMTHSYFKRGLWLTFDFFLFAFIVAMIKELPTNINGILLQDPHNPYNFTSGYVILNSLVVITGWVFTFYLGWSIAELVLKRAKPFNNYIFPTLLMCYVVIASIAYAVEATALSLGWWQWTFSDTRFTSSIVAAPFISFEAWPNFSIQYLLLPFFLIKLSIYKQTEWKNIFILIPFIHIATTRCDHGYFRVFEEYFVLVLIFLLSIIKPLPFEYSNAKCFKTHPFFNKKRLDIIPLMVIMLLLVTLCIFDITRLKDLKILITLLPLSFLTLLAIEKVPFILLVMLSFGLLFINRNIMFLPIIPVIVVAIFKIYVIRRHHLKN
ncbi:MAG: hypothetical protein ISS47_01670 [Candidatus Omnitrophica bacterium]|nr:hypothetical protein [Candidatus Omnitrophota bacterium]